ncbi:MAG: nucleotidyltransferase family protein [Pseudomonadales bacterium]
MSGATLLLAAGAGTRFGSDKRLALTSTGLPLLAATIARYACLGWPIYIVIRPEDSDLPERIRRDLHGTTEAARLHWVVAVDAHLGMGHSLRAGVDALLDDGFTEALVGLGDMPYVRAATLRSLQLLLLESASADLLARPRHQSRPGNPVGFSHTQLRKLVHLSGDVGARQLLQQQHSHVTWLEVDDPGVLQDVDRPEDLLGH